MPHPTWVPQHVKQSQWPQTQSSESLFQTGYPQNDIEMYQSLCWFKHTSLPHSRNLAGHPSFLPGFTAVNIPHGSTQIHILDSWCGILVKPSSAPQAPNSETFQLSFLAHVIFSSVLKKLKCIRKGKWYLPTETFVSLHRLWCEVSAWQSHIVCYLRIRF